ncbi:MAG: hypothetical protein ACKO6N_23610 [Myxococcota bacterium]
MSRRSSLPALLTAAALAWHSAPASAAECVDTSPADAQAAIEDARRAVLTLEYDATLAKLDEVRKSLVCLTGTIPQETLALLHFFQGVLSFNEGDAEAAKQAFQDAAAVQPLLQEDREHDSKIRELWAATRDEVTKTTGTLVVPNLPKDAIAYVDGRPLQSGSQQATVYPGLHLLQVMGDDRKLHGTLMRVRPGETSLVPAEFLTSLTPRGELVLDVKPRGTKVVIRQGNQPGQTIKNAKRRTQLADMKEGAYIVEVTKPGYYAFSQGKVAVEGNDQTLLNVSLERRPNVSLNVRGGRFWVSAGVPYDDPVMSFDLVGRNTQGWGLHLEYLYHLVEKAPDNFEANPDYDPTALDTIDNFPPEYPVVTTKDLPLPAALYIGVSKQWRVEGVDISVGPKLAFSFDHANAKVDVCVGYEPVPWVGLSLNVSAGAMMHMSDYIWDMLEDDTLGQYVRGGAIGSITGGIKVGF